MAYKNILQIIIMKTITVLITSTTSSSCRRNQHSRFSYCFCSSSLAGRRSYKTKPNSYLNPPKKRYFVPTTRTSSRSTSRMISPPLLAMRNIQNNQKRNNNQRFPKSTNNHYKEESLTQFHYEDDDDFNPFIFDEDDDDEQQFNDIMDEEDFDLGDEDTEEKEEQERLLESNKDDTSNSGSNNYNTDNHSSAIASAVSTTEKNVIKTNEELDLMMSGPWAAMAKLKEKQESTAYDNNIYPKSVSSLLDSTYPDRQNDSHDNNNIVDYDNNKISNTFQIGSRVPNDGDNILPPFQTEPRKGNNGNSNSMQQKYYYNKDDDEESLVQKINVTEQYISATYNNDQPINLNSHKQVATLLYGGDQPSLSTSTDKDTLEALCTSNNSKLADIAQRVLQWRQLKKQLKRIQQQKKIAAATVEQQQRNDNNLEEEEASRYIDDPLILVDASAFIYRAYHAMPPFHRTDGTPVGAVLGFCNMINRLVMGRILEANNAKDPRERLSPPRIALVFDSGKPNFRHELYAKYKANRPPCPVDLMPQFDLIHQAAYAFGIPTLIPTTATNVSSSDFGEATSATSAYAYEADDIIATVTAWAIEQGISVNLISSDKDLLQLVRDAGSNDANSFTTSSSTNCRVQMIDPLTMERKTEADVIKKWGVPPSKLGDLLALVGDSTDNVPGIPGIGPKTAASLLQEFESLDSLLSNINTSLSVSKSRKEKIILYKNQAVLSRKLVDLCVDVPPECILHVVPPKDDGSYPTGSKSIKNENPLPSTTETITATILNKNDVVNLRMDELNQKRLISFFESMGFRDLTRRMKNQFNTAAATKIRNGLEQHEPINQPQATLIEDSTDNDGHQAPREKKMQQIPLSEGNGNKAKTSANTFPFDEVPF